MLSLEGLNWLAIIVSGVVYFIIGALWYAVLFTKPFVHYRFGGTIPSSESGQPIEYLFTFIADTVSALVLALILKAAGAASLVDGLVVGLVVAAGLSAASTLVYTIYSGPHKMLWVIYSGYLLTAYAVMGIILTLWK